MSQAIAKPSKRLRLHTSSAFASLLCYLICFALPLLWQAAGLWLVYPYKLAHTAPPIAETLLSLLPFRPAALVGAAQAAALPTGGGASLWAQALSQRDLHWQLFGSLWLAAAWLITLILQLLWRIRHNSALNAARLARRAKASYRLHLLLILLINAAFAAFLYAAGVSQIPHRTLWDTLVYFPAYGLNVLAAMACFRLAAPAAISGKHAFFKRL